MWWHGPLPLFVLHSFTSTHVEFLKMKETFRWLTRTFKLEGAAELTCKQHIVGWIRYQKYCKKEKKTNSNNIKIQAEDPELPVTPLCYPWPLDMCQPSTHDLFVNNIFCKKGNRFLFQWQREVSGVPRRIENSWFFYERLHWELSFKVKDCLSGWWLICAFWWIFSLPSSHKWPAVSQV